MTDPREIAPHVCSSACDLEREYDPDDREVDLMHPNGD